MKCNLKVLLAERNLKITKVSNDTGISRTTLTALSSGEAKGIQFDTLENLCNYLNISIDNLFCKEETKIKKTEVDCKKIGKLIRIKRKLNDYSLKQVGKILNVSESAVSRYESGEIKSMKIDKVLKLCNFLEMSPNHLFDVTEEDFDE